MRKQGARGAGAADVGHTWGQGGRKMSKARPRDRYCRSRWGFRLTPDATCLPRHKGTPARGQVARQRAGVGHRHGACQDTCLGRGRGARMCVHAAREVPLARSQHGLGQLLTPFLPQNVSNVIRGPISLPFAEKSLTSEKRRVRSYHFTLYFRVRHSQRFLRFSQAAN